MAETLAKNLVVPQDLLSSSQKIAGSKHTYIKLYPTRGSGPITYSANGTTTVQFEFPTHGINYPLSKMAGLNTIPASGAGRYNWCIKDSVAFVSSASYKARTGGTFFDIDYLQNYTKIVNRYEKDLIEVQTNDEHDAIFACRHDDPIFATTETLEYKNHADADQTQVVVTAIPEDLGDLKRYNNQRIAHRGVEAQYVKNATVDEDLEDPFQFSLADVVPNTLWSKTHDVKLPEICVLTIKLGPGNRYAWNTDDYNDPSSDPQPCGDITLTDFHILLSINDDPVMENWLDRELAQGVRYPLNTVICTQNQRTTTNQNVTVTYNSGHGKRLVRIYHSIFNSAETYNNSLDNNCAKGAVYKIKEYTVKLNDRSTTEQALSLEDEDYPTAYLYHKPLLKGSSVTNADIYRANFVHIEDIGRLGSPYEQYRHNVRPASVIAGVSLDQDYKFTFTSTADNNADVYNHYTFAIVQRELAINSTSVLIN